MSISNDKNKSWAIITGASSGIGKEYALQLAKRGYALHLVARREERLQELSRELSTQTSATYTVCDLANYAERVELLEKLAALSLDVSLVVNNAGFGSVGPFVERELATELEMVELNCRAPLHITRHFLPEMYRKGRGAIINVCSTASFQPMPLMATYGSTKAFLYSFSLAVNAESRRHGVRCLAHCPGPTDTEFHLVSGLPEKMSHLQAMQVDVVVKQALLALEGGKTVCINGSVNRLLAAASRVIPGPIAARLVRWVLRDQEK